MNDAMKRIKLIVGLLAVLVGGLAVFWVLRDPKALVIHPKGWIAHQELRLIATSYSLMLIVVVPTLLALFFVAWKFRAKNRKARYLPEQGGGKWVVFGLWAFPSLIIAVLSLVLWKTTHELDPYQPLKSDLPPLKIQVVALDWKWLFIYPQQGIASLNYVQIPEKIPIHFELAADGSPMNSFWIPQLSGQIYAMTGMKTQIHMMADGVGTYTGRAAEINGAGFADMIFEVRSTSPTDFQGWVDLVKLSPASLTKEVYEQLVLPSQKNPITLYSSVEGNLFHHILMKYMAH